MKCKAIVLFLVFAWSPANAQSVVKWGEEGDWKIFVNPDIGNGCYAEKQFPDGVLVQIGAEPLRAGGFFAAYHADWTDIEQGASGTLFFDFGSEKFAGDGEGRMLGELRGGHAFFDNPNFVTEFAGRNSVKISGDSNREFEIDLGGTSRAIKAVQSCQSEQPKPDQG
ncbi:MAG: hypothetical protein AB3N23_03820 [Paracoccaceae bacterium]